MKESGAVEFFHPLSYFGPSFLHCFIPSLFHSLIPSFNKKGTPVQASHELTRSIFQELVQGKSNPCQEWW